MKRKNIILIFVLAAVITICALSPLFVSKLLDGAKVGKIQMDKTPTHGSQTELSLAEKIRIYSHPESVVESQPEDSQGVLKEEFAKENAEIYSIVRNEISELQKRGLFSDDVEQIFDEETAWAYQVYTCMGFDGNYVTVWRVSITGYGYMEMEILSDSQKIVCMTADFCLNIFDYEGLDDSEEMSWFSEAWGDYLGLESAGGTREDMLFQYREERGTNILYTLAWETDSFSISLYIYPKMEPEELDQEGEIESG